MEITLNCADLMVHVLVNLLLLCLANIILQFLILLEEQPRSQGLRGETVTKTLVKFVLSFQNFGEKIACAVRHNRIQPLLQYGCVALRMRFFPQNFGTMKRILPGSSSPSHREGPGTEVVRGVQFFKSTKL